MIPQTAALYFDLIARKEAAMPLKPRIKVKAIGIPIAGVLVKTDDTGKQRIVKNDTAPPHVRAGRRRKVNKVTGVRAAK